MDIVDIKRKLRELKRLELKIRYGSVELKRPSLVWDIFFDLHEISAGKAKYTLKNLANISHDEYKNVISEYWSFVYNELFSENDLHNGINYDTSILLQLNLPFDADEKAVKKRFRELAKLYHPDTGGDANKFIALIEAYKRLIGK